LIQYYSDNSGTLGIRTRHKTIYAYYLPVSMAYEMKERKLGEGERAANSIFYVTCGKKRQRD